MSNFWQKILRNAKKLENEAKETAYKKAQMSDLTDKNFKAAIINILKN